MFSSGHMHNVNLSIRFREETELKWKVLERLRAEKFRANNEAKLSKF